MGLKQRIPLPIRRVASKVFLRDVRFLYKLPYFTYPVRSCPICGGQPTFEHQAEYTPLDRCTRCDHVYARLAPKKRILKRIYRDFSYWEGDKGHQGIHGVAPSDEWKVFIDVRLKALRHGGFLDDSGEKKRFFEIGCSEGMLVKALTDLGHEAAGCDMNPGIIAKGREALRVDIRLGMFEDMDLPRNYYDGVLTFHTLEHVRDVVKVLEQVVEVLKPGGGLVLEVPCGPQEYVNNDHLHFFSEQSLKALLGKFFEEVELIPNNYDAVFGETVSSFYGIGRRVKK
ncbi:MAG: class I SAM-dependent methyltransferase [FCB group bacterium]|jgi:2-polyprenyl-3-methyl-5-hydroxy-6-metoxy-1,4-benzoquinol methylase|nr:class I SAM-dependent methyltransferase [FCB group bacterium]